MFGNWSPFCFCITRWWPVQPVPPPLWAFTEGSQNWSWSLEKPCLQQMCVHPYWLNRFFLLKHETKDENEQLLLLSGLIGAVGREQILWRQTKLHHDILQTEIILPIISQILRLRQRGRQATSQLRWPSSRILLKKGFLMHNTIPITSSSVRLGAAVYVDGRADRVYSALSSGLKVLFKI